MLYVVYHIDRYDCTMWMSIGRTCISTHLYILCQSDELGLFEWRDGVVVQAMREGGVLLIDEISLADDAVLERLNSVLEPERKLLVSERSWMEGEVYEIVAADGFVFLGTMNPGGDYGKKEVGVCLSIEKENF